MNNDKDIMVFNRNLIDFLKRHNIYDEEALRYASENTTMIDYRNPDQTGLASCLYAVDKKDILKRILIIVPYVYDDISMFASIHELTHVMLDYKNIGKKRNRKMQKTWETLPILMEKLYVKESQNPEVIEYSEERDKERAGYPEYDFSLKVMPALLATYDNNIRKTKKRIRKLAREIN